MTWKEITDFRKEIGFRLGRLRLAKGLTGQDVADALQVMQEGGKSVGTVSRIENGNQAITTDVLKIYAELLGTTVADLVTSDEVFTPEMIETMGSMNAEYREMAIVVLNAVWQQYKARYKKEQIVKKKKPAQQPSFNPSRMGYTTMLTGNSFSQDYSYYQQSEPEPEKKPRFVIVDTELIPAASRDDQETVDRFVSYYQHLLDARIKNMRKK